MADVSSITYDLAAYAQLDERLLARPELYLDRYFTQRFYARPIAAKRKHDDDPAESSSAGPHDDACAIPREWQYVRMAPNKLCVVGLASLHPLLDPELRSQYGPVSKIVFFDNVKSCVIKGKRKKQSLRLMPNSKLCTVHTQNGNMFVVHAAVRGTLMEWNQRLEDDPNLLTRSPDQAFVAIVKPTTDDDEKIFSECVAEI
ncbi:hypothetical protein LPJ70_004902 [Coemansia sp. RSA 2708]|nr:hypothetical protein LPJ70_004902 [Coemansia sp. RSA 2708]